MAMAVQALETGNLFLVPVDGVMGEYGHLSSACLSSGDGAPRARMHRHKLRCSLLLIAFAFLD
jgi:hypothetical protein